MGQSGLGGADCRGDCRDVVSSVGGGGGAAEGILRFNGRIDVEEDIITGTPHVFYHCQGRTYL